jgi:type III secretory pathway component EscV
MSITDGMLLELREAVPAIAALAVLLVASAVLDGWPLVAVIVLAVLGMFAAFVYRDRSARGIERRRARERFAAQLDETERRGRESARLVPIALGIAVGVIAGFDGRVFAVTVLVGLLAGQLIFGLWLHARRRARGAPPSV